MLCPTLNRRFVPTADMRPVSSKSWFLFSGIEQDWLRHDMAYVELRAVAKEMLGLPRESAH
jgi:hypothetical protein